MSLILLLSILIRLIALCWSFVLVRRTRDWRMGFLSVMVGLMATRQILTLVTEARSLELSLTTHTTELPGLAVSAMALLTVFFLERMLRDRKQVEDQLRHAQKMEAVGRLAGGLAHDLNNLLTVINGYSEYLLQRIRKEDSTRRPIEEVLNAGRRASDLIRQLLAFSRRQVLNPSVLDLNSLVADQEDMLGRLLGEDIELVVRLAPGAHRVRADGNQLQQAILNLAVNARDAMPDGGKLVITTSSADLDGSYVRENFTTPADSYVELAVSDTGTGMKEEVRARVFEPFFTTKESGKGTGLGLSTAYGMMKQSAGHIEVESKQGKGTTFRLFFPAVGAPALTTAPAPLRQEPTRGKETILLVEDEEMVRRLLGKLLQEQGYRILEAGNGKEALALWDHHSRSIDLLLTDLVMPGMGGSELARRLCASKPGMGVLYMTGYADGAARQPVPEDRLLNKPVPMELLSRRVRETLDAVPAGTSSSGRSL